MFFDEIDVDPAPIYDRLVNLIDNSRAKVKDLRKYYKLHYKDLDDIHIAEEW